MVNESGSQFLSTIIVLGFAQDTRKVAVYNSLEKSLSTIFVLGLWGGPPWATQKLQQNCSQWEHPETVAETVPIGNTQRLWQGVSHRETPQRLRQGVSHRETPQRLRQGVVAYATTLEIAAELRPWGAPRGYGRGVLIGNTQRLRPWGAPRGCGRGVPRWDTVAHLKGCGRSGPRWTTQRLWQGWSHMGPLKRLWQRLLPYGNTQRLWQRLLPYGNTQRLWQRLFPRGPLRDCGRGNQFEKRTAFIKYIYSSSSRRIYKTTTTTTSASFFETETVQMWENPEIQCF